jgi:hypothetical protein
MVEVQDVLEPNGPIQAGMFPADTTEKALNDRIQAYLDDGMARVAAFRVANPTTTLTDDAAVRAWASYRAFEARYFTLSTNPADVNLTDQGGRSYLQTQINAFYNKAREFKAEYDGLLANSIPRGTENRRESYGTVVVPTRFVL